MEKANKMQNLTEYMFLVYFPFNSEALEIIEILVKVFYAENAAEYGYK